MDFDKITIKQDDIVKISANGEITKDTFETSYWYDTYRHPYSYSHYFDYIEEDYETVKSIANLFGYSEEDVVLLPYKTTLFSNNIHLNILSTKFYYHIKLHYSQTKFKQSN